MSERAFFLKVGAEAPRGPLGEKAVREALRSGVIGGDALLGPTSEGPFVPLAAALGSGQRGGAKWVIAIVGLAAIVVLGGGAGGFAYYWKTRPPKLCPATPKLIASLEDTLEIDAYVTRGTPGLDAFVRDLDRLLRGYRAAGRGRVIYRLVEVRTDAERAAAKEAGLVPQPIGDGATGDVREAFMGLVFKYGAERDFIKFLTPDSADGLEFWITNKIREIRARGSGVKYAIGVVTGDDELALSEPNLVPHGNGAPSLAGIIAQNFPFYRLASVDLAKPIDPDIRALVVTQPGRDLDQPALEAIDAFVMRGKPVAIVASAANVHASDGTMRVTLATHGLERLLVGYGVVMHADVVSDPSSGYAVRVFTANGPTTVRASFIPVVGGEEASGEIDARSPVFFRVPRVAFPFASSLGVDKAKQPAADFRVLATTSDSSSASTGDGEALSPFAAPVSGGSAPPRARGPAGPTTVALSVEGRLTSAFGGGKSTPTARLLVISSSQFLANPFARAGNPPADAGETGLSRMYPGDDTLLQVAVPYAQTEMTSTILVFKNTLDWLSFDDDFTACALPAADREAGARTTTKPPKTKR